MKKCFLFIFLFFSLNFVGAQTGIIQGVVKDSKNKETLIGSTVLIQNTSIGVITNIDGKFVLTSLNPGTYNLKISYISYNTKEQVVKVESNKTTQIEIELEEISVLLSGVTVTAIKKNNTEISAIDNIKFSNVVMSGISAQLISKTQDKDASEVVKRLPGVSIVDDKFIIIRGLSSRYNNVWINNSTAPSSEPDTRSFSFDIIPSSIIESIYIFKSPMAELPADYSGGFIKISTIGIPTNNALSFSYGTNFNQGTTFKDFYIKGNDWSPNKITAMLDQKFSLNLQRKFQNGNFMMGNTTAISYSYTNDFNQILNNNYSIYDFKSDKPSINDEFNDSQYKNTQKVGLLHNWTFYPTNNLKIDFKNFINNIYQTSTSIREGREWYADGRYIKSTELASTKRFIYTGQLGLEKKFGNNILDLTTGYSISNKKDPDIRRYRYLSYDNQNYIILFGTNPDLSSLSQMSLNLNEDILTSSLNYTHNFKLFELKSGVFFENKSRSFNARNFGYVIPNFDSDLRNTNLLIDEIITKNELKFKEVTAPSDSYISSEQMISGYVNGKLNISKFSISGGLRIEKDLQTLDSYRQGTTTPVNIKRDTINLFPSANIAYNINSKNLIRATYGLSLNRPEFREIAPFYFVDFDLNAGIYGNEKIKSAYVHNFDLRYEMYPKNGETFNIGVFYKRFIDPIEVVIRGNNPTQFSFDNVPYAYTYGIEAEIRKSLDFISLDKFSMVGNLSLMKSSILFDRPLQGQSPYIINLGLYYSEEKTSASITYNRIGKRIIAVGRPSPNEWESIPDIYEMPRNEMNIFISRKLSKHLEIKGGIKDIFDENNKYQQNINTNVDMTTYNSDGIKYFNRNQTTRLYRPGRQFMITLSYKF